MQRVKGAVFFQLVSSAAGTAIKISRLQPSLLSLSLPFMQKAPCVYACPPRLTCQISGAALHGAGEAFGITPCSLAVCARAIFAQVVSYTRCQLLQSRRNLLLSVLRQPLASSADALVSERTFSAFSGHQN
jgi:hypothetical protein